MATLKKWRAFFLFLMSVYHGVLGMA